MAEATPTETYQSFCDEEASLTATILALEAAPTLATLDDLSAATTRRELVRAALPDLCTAAERYAKAERDAATMARMAPLWATAAGEKAALLATISGLCEGLRAAVEAYSVQHVQQLRCLQSLDWYSPAYRGNYAPMVQRLVQVVGSCVHEDTGQHAWGLAQLGSFDTIGKSSTLPTE